MTFPPLRLRQAISFGGLSPRETAIRTWKKTQEHEVMTRASAIAFYAMLACVPFLALLLSVLVQLLPDLSGFAGHRTGVGDMTVEQLQSTLRSVLPKEAYAIAEDQIARLQKEFQTRPPIGLLVLGLATTLWLASSLYTAVIDALDRIYGVTETRSLVKIRITAIVMTIIQAIILLSALVAIVAGPELLGWFGYRGSGVVIGRIVQFAVVWVMVLISFALTFYVGPDAEQKWEWLTPGSFIGSVVFLLFTYLFRIYVANFANYNKTYGSLGGVMVLLFWFWVSATVLLMAGQLNKVVEDASPLGKNYGQKIDPTKAPDFSQVRPEPAERPS